MILSGFPWFLMKNQNSSSVYLQSHGDFEVTEEIHLMNSVYGIATDRNIY